MLTRVDKQLVHYQPACSVKCISPNPKSVFICISGQVLVRRRAGCSVILDKARQAANSLSAHNLLVHTSLLEGQISTAKSQRLGQRIYLS